MALQTLFARQHHILNPSKLHNFVKGETRTSLVDKSSIDLPQIVGEGYTLVVPRFLETA